MTELSPEEKARIEAEERERARARQKAEGELKKAEAQKEASKFGKGCLGCAGAIVLLVIAIGIWSGVSGTKDAATPEGGVYPAAALPISAADLYRAYKANEVAADGAYKGKLLAVSGTVHNVGKDILGTPYVALDDALQVQCMFSPDQKAELADLRPGQSVVVEGKCDGFLIEVILRDCRVAMR